MNSSHESLQVFSCWEVLTTVFTRETKMTSSHESLQVFSCCEVLTTVFTREMKMTYSHEYLQAFTQREAISLYSMSETYPCEVCRETFQQNTHSGGKSYPCTVCHRHILVNNVERHFLKHVGLGINKRLIQERSHFLVQYVTDISL